MKSNKQAQREAKQLFRHCLAGGVIDDTKARSVADELLSAGSRDSATVLGHFLRLVRIDQARHTASIESAVPLAPEVRAAISRTLSTRYGVGLITIFSERPELIGGVRIQVGCDVYDGSVRAGLQALESSF